MTTGKEAASEAGKELRNPQTPAPQKKVDGSDLSQAEKKESE